MSFTDNLDILMQQKNINRKELAELAEIPLQTCYSWWSRGSTPSVIHGYKAAKALGVTVEAVIEGDAYNPYRIPDRVRPLINSILTLDQASLASVETIVDALVAKQMQAPTAGYDQTEVG